MKEYAEELIQKLNCTREIMKVNDIEVELKKVPDTDAAGSLDPRVQKEITDEMQYRQAQKSEFPPSLEEIREEMGGFNYNLNTIEIYTKYLEVQTAYGNVPVWMYFPKKSRKNKDRCAYLYVHGGAFFGGSVFAVENECRLIAERANCVTFNIDYSLAPENPFPIPCTQVYEVLQYIYNHAAKLGIDKNKIAVGGDSAGGNLAAVCAQMDRDKGTNYLKLQTLIYPKLTFTNYDLPGYSRNIEVFHIAEEQKQYLPMLTYIGSDESNAGDEKVYVQGTEDIKNPYISPAFGEKEGLCRTLLLLAEYDGLRLEGEFYAGLLKKAGIQVRVIRYNGMRHGFFDRLGIFPQAEAVVNEIAAEINKM
jgi:acetyl esterase/lipase